MIEQLTEEQETLIDQRIDQWLSIARSTEPADRQIVEKQINKFYGLNGFAHPAVVWCSSPWQMCALAFVLQIIKRSERDNACKRWLRSLKRDEQWSAVWKQYEECKDLFTELLKEPRDTSLLDSIETKKVNDFLFRPMSLQRLYIEDALELKIAANVRTQVTQRVQANFQAPLNNAFRLPLEADLLMQLQRLGRKALDSLNSQVRPKKLTLSEHAAVNRFKSSRTGKVEDTIFGARSLSTLVNEKLLARSVILPSIMHECNYFPYIFLNSNLPIECRKVISLITWPWQDHTPLIHMICCDLLGEEAAEIHKNFNLELWCEFMKSCLAVLPIGNVCFVCDRPGKLEIDEWGRLHCNSEPALVFPDGSAVFAWHGNIVHRSIIESPDSIDLEEIESETNIETKRVLIEVYGEARYLEETGAFQQDLSEYGTLYRKSIPFDDDLVMVKVLNSTAEPDGSFKSYYLRVPPTVKTAKEAVAWTFGMIEEEYNPDLES